MESYSKQLFFVLCFSFLLISCQQHYTLVASPQFSAQDVAAAQKIDIMHVASVIDRRPEKSNCLLGDYFDTEKSSNTIAYTATPLEDIIASSINMLIAKDSSSGDFKPYNIYIDNYQFGEVNSRIYLNYRLTFVFPFDGGTQSSIIVNDVIYNQNNQDKSILDSLFKKSILDAANSFSKQYTLFNNKL